MARLDPVSGKIDEYAIPYKDGHAFPRRMNVDANGDIWVGLWNAGLLMKIDYETRHMSFFAPPTETSGTYSVSVDRKNNLIWVSEQQADKIARFNPKTEQFTEYRIPQSPDHGYERFIAADPKGRVWFTEYFGDRIGFVELRPSQNPPILLHPVDHAHFVAILKIPPYAGQVYSLRDSVFLQFGAWPDSGKH